jgi:hypothetical protein
MSVILAALNWLCLAVVPPYGPAVHSGAAPLPGALLIGMVAGVLLVLAVQHLLTRTSHEASRPDAQTTRARQHTT